MQWINTQLERILAALMILMTLVVIWGVITRYIFNDQVSWSEEVARFLLIWIGILGAAYASGKKMHLSIDLLREKLSERNENILNIVIASIVFLFAFSVMFIGGFRLIYIVGKLQQHSPALHIPMQLIYLVIPISGLLIMLFKTIEIKEQLKKL